MNNRNPPKRTSAECAAAGRKGKTRSPWFRQPHVHRDQNWERMRQWEEQDKDKK